MVGKIFTVMAAGQQQHCLEIFACPNEALALPDADRRKVVQGLTRSSPPGGFKPNELAGKAALSFWQEAYVVVVLAIVMGGPLLLLPSFIYCAMQGWEWLLCWFVLVYILAFHPVPTHPMNGRQTDAERGLAKSKLASALYRYFSYRFVWSGDAKEKCEKVPAWIGAGPPHGVLPFANVLSIPAINTFSFRHFVGAGASVVPKTPFLRYMSCFGFIDVSSKTIARALDAGTCVGTVPDGIAGIFSMNKRPLEEVVKLKDRKGIARLALRTGHPIVPAYSIGNTAAFSAWFDPFGLLERASRAVQASLFIYWGRFLLPIPRRTNITMLIGQPIVVDKVEDPTAEQVDAVHQRLLTEMAELFDTHKAALGWGHKKIVFE